MSKCALILVLGWVVLCLGGPVAHADDIDRLGLPTNPEAKALLEQGNIHYRLHEFDEAIKFYKQGALVEPAPIFLYNLGQCYRQLGDHKQAIWHYQRFLDQQNPDDEVRMYVSNFIDVAKAALDQEAKDQPPTEPGGGGSAGADQAVHSDSPAPWYSDKIGWALTGTGTVAALVGGGFLMSAAGLDDDAANEPDQPTRVELKDKASSRRTIGAILTVGGGAMLVAGIVKLVMAPKKEPPNERGISWIVGTNWVGVTGSF